jgi:hypothetical protein
LYSQEPHRAGGRVRAPGRLLGSVTSFGEDSERELYVVAYEGKIWKLEAK